MAGGPYAQGTVTVANTATKIAGPPDGTAGIWIQNNGSVAVFLGGPTVTASGATAGPSLAASASALFPTAGGGHDLYGITASSTASVSYLYPVT